MVINKADFAVTELTSKHKKAQLPEPFLNFEF
jgi:hypothetical protein